jgi:crotonobetainyl-CoA:carnitine CoA-transferase CaiB-like acyl-CoA transferase
MEEKDRVADAGRILITSLDGIRVVDLTTNVAGPFATQILGDLGAIVVKVERPGTGDDARSWGPPFWDPADEQMSVSFSALNRNKRSVVLDLKSDAGISVLRELVREADVLVQNLRPGALARLGLSAEQAQKLNPRLVYCEITGYGLTGPRAGEPAYDPLMQAYSGLMSITGEDGREPVRIPVSIIDKTTGMWAVIGIMNALRLRDREGRGSHVSASLLETALDWIGSQIMMYMASGQVLARLGSAAPGIAPYQAFATSDQHIVVSAGNQRLWQRLCATIGRPDLLENPRFATNADRFVNRKLLASEIEATLGQAGADQWLQMLTEAGIPCAPIRTIDQIPNDPQVASSEMLLPGRDDLLGELTFIATPVRTDGKRFSIERLPPRLGADTDDVVARLWASERGRTVVP